MFGNKYKKKLIAFMEGLECQGDLEQVVESLSVEEIRKFGELCADRSKELMGKPNKGLFYDEEYTSILQVGEPENSE